MKKNEVKLLKRIVETPSPTGFETGVAGLVREVLSDIADEMHTDTMGSVHAAYIGSLHHDGATADKSASSSSGSADSGSSASSGTDSMDARLAEANSGTSSSRHTLMFAAHMDEIGLMVSYISPEGFLSVSSIGGVDAAILPGMRVDVHTAEGPLRGVVGRKPIHLIDADDRKTVTALDKLVIDLGMSAKHVKKSVTVGDPITFAVGFERFGDDMAVSRAFDDKCGVFIGCRIMEELASDPSYTGNFVAAMTVQEEIGTRGAMTSAHAIEPDVAIAFDVTHATDYPGIDKSQYGEIICGKGPVIARGPNINPVVFERLVAAAEAEGIEYQIEAEPSVTGTDARAIQVTRGGIPTGLVSIPLRYMHTPTEVINIDDVKGAIKLITRFARDLDRVRDFIPGHPEDIVSDEKVLDDGFDDIEYLTSEVERLGDELVDLQTMVELGSYADTDDADDFVDRLSSEVDARLGSANSSKKAEDDDSGADAHQDEFFSDDEEEALFTDEDLAGSMDSVDSDIDSESGSDVPAEPQFLKQQEEINQELRDYAVDVPDPERASDDSGTLRSPAPAIKIALVDDEEEYEDEDDDDDELEEIEVFESSVDSEEAADSEKSDEPEETTESEQTHELDGFGDGFDDEFFQDELIDPDGAAEESGLDFELEEETFEELIDQDAEVESLEEIDDLDSPYGDVELVRVDSPYLEEDEEEESDTMTFDQFDSDGVSMPTMSMPIVSVTSVEDDEEDL